MGKEYTYELKGMRKVEANLNVEINAIRGRSMKGLIEAAAYIRRSMDKTPPLIPIDVGNLRGSWFTSPLRKTLHKFGLLIGFSAGYATHVHEMVDKGGKKINWSRPGSGPKFFETALNRGRAAILALIQQHARIKR